jgi:hypothetical protein
MEGEMGRRGGKERWDIGEVGRGRCARSSPLYFEGTYSLFYFIIELFYLIIDAVGRVTHGAVALVDGADNLSVRLSVCQRLFYYLAACPSVYVCLLSVCLSVRLCLFYCLSACPSVRLCLFIICLPVQLNIRDRVTHDAVLFSIYFHYNCINFIMELFRIMIDAGGRVTHEAVALVDGADGERDLHTRPPAQSPRRHHPPTPPS